MPDLPFLIAELCSTDDRRAETAAHALAEHGQAAVDALTPLIRSPDPDTRWWAVRALALLPDIDVTDWLLTGLEDEDTSVQQCAAIALRERPDSYAIPDLIYLLDHDDRLLARLAADALIALGKQASQALVTAMEKGQQKARLEAIRALAAIADPDTASALFKLLEDESQIIQYWAEQGLEKMGIGMLFFKPD